MDPAPAASEEAVLEEGELPASHGDILVRASQKPFWLVGKSYIVCLDIGWKLQLRNNCRRVLPHMHISLEKYRFAMTPEIRPRDI